MRSTVFAKNIRSFCKIAFALISTQYSLMLEYRAEIILWALSGVLPLIMLSIWIGPDSLLSNQQTIYFKKYFQQISRWINF